MGTTIQTLGWREGAERATRLTVTADSLARMDRPPAGKPPRRERGAPDSDPFDPRQGRWALVALASDRAEVERALAPLIAWRREAGHLWNDGIIALDPGRASTADAWERCFTRAVGKGAAGKSLRPPTYLLFVGGPDRIPFDLQTRLDPKHATGRLDASDTPGGPFSWEACARYAERVVKSETGQLSTGAEELFFAPSPDEATRTSRELLVERMASPRSGYRSLYGEQATLAALTEALESPQPPRVLFTASHGVEHPADPVRWGALATHEYEGRPAGPVLGAREVAALQRAGHGSVIFSFACFSGGVPETSTVRFLAGSDDAPEEMALQVSPLPRQLLGHEAGPVAVVGHVDRVSAVAFLAPAKIDPYVDFLDWLQPHRKATLGRAMRTLRESAMELGHNLALVLAEATQRAKDPATVTNAGKRWVGFHDFVGFMLLGDPALAPSGGKSP